ncbi:TonB-dependent receptor domain-containing protein [Sphingomonas quercus]|uniref:TonB-dependent receptor n=1 Tax=Sphingomonas quercus TaxID=2842451 RepID=A0ABS6BEU9_9SPHN|nr:TonB-dependent receptor [Sphingomonas quercus]MBU3076832.1 TonB-dependent receptor [Sphingomonas quercus]
MSVIGASTAAFAQDVVPAAAEEPRPQEIVVTGSRIRTTDTTTPAPVTVVNAAAVTDRGFTQIGQALNELPSITPSFPRNTGIGNPASGVQTAPQLFNMGAGRTLSLMNGRRLPTTAVGTADAAVDANIIPTGLIERVDVMQAGGAAVYGSGAMAGAVNYVLKRNFQGLELDGQASITSRGDYPVYSLRGTFGQNFAEDRGNFAINLEYSQSGVLKFPDREASRLVPFLATNPADTGPNDGIPNRYYILNSNTWSSTYNGAIWATTGTTPAGLLNVSGRPVEFNTAGNGLTTFNPGENIWSNLSINGGGVPYNSKSTLFAGIKRFNAFGLGSYELTDNIQVSTELLYSRTKSKDPLALMRVPQFDNTGTTAGGTQSFLLYADNAYLQQMPDVLAQLTTAAAARGINFVPGGSPLYLAKFADNLFKDTSQTLTTTTYRGLLAVDGDFSAGQRDFDWSVSVSRGHVSGRIQGWGLWQSRLRNSFDAVRNAAGNIVCRINQTTVTDANCVPVNLFGRTNISDQARDYINIRSGFAQNGQTANYVNDLTDYLASFGGDLVQLPAGKAKFNVTYEHRIESTKTTPEEADRLGLIGSGTKLAPMSGGFHTNEINGEVLVPIVGGDFTLPLVRALEATGSFRFVDDSLVGKENVWSAGLRWDVFRGLTLRSSLSRNFRAPNLSQLAQPQTTNVAGSGNPCSNATIQSGSNPAVRAANCLALFTANPTYGATGNPAIDSNPAARLSNFFDIGQNFFRTLVTTGGNPDLRNEVSKTLTFGLVFQPTFVPGLTFTADRIRLNLTDALSNFTAANFTATCFDTPGMPADICSTFTFRPDGTIATAKATTFNAGYYRYRGDIFVLSYRFNVGTLFGGRDLGNLALSLQATHNRMRDQSVTGLDVTHSAGTTALPSWVLRPQATYSIGRLRLNYSAYYMPAEPINFTDTVENAPVLPVKGNTRHNISAAYGLDKFEIRAGINNFTDKAPSFPYSAGYGDIIGRQFFLGVKVNY